MFKNIFRKTKPATQPQYTKTKRLDFFMDGFGNAVELLEVVDRHNVRLRYEVFTHLDHIRLDKPMNIPGVTAGVVTFPATDEGRTNAMQHFYNHAYGMLDEEPHEIARIRDRVLRNPELRFACA